MRYLFICLVGICECFFSAATAQPNYPIVTSGKITYTFTTRNSLISSGRSNTIDTGYLYFNDTASSYHIQQRKAVADDFYKRMGENELFKTALPSILERLQEREKRNFYFHTAGSNVLFSPWVPPSGDDWYCIPDTVPQFKWTLLPDTTRILGFLCQGAVFKSAALGGVERTYTAWFAPDLAYAYGPFRFFGLPGIILALDTKFYNYRAIAIDIPIPADGLFPIVCCSELPTISKSESERITGKQRTDLDNMRKLRTENP